MQMRTGRAAGGADLADGLADRDALADLDVDLRHMTVAGRKSVAMVDFDHVAVAAIPAGSGDGAVGGDAHRIAFVTAQIDAGMDRRSPHERVHAHAER